MTVNIVGDSYTRPIVYTCIKVFQTLGDVLVVTPYQKTLRLSDTGESGGHYQNTMICFAEFGYDDFFMEFKYAEGDFDFIIVENMLVADADITVYAQGYTQTDHEKELLEYIEEYHTVKPYKDKWYDARTMYNMEEFEALRDMCPMGTGIAKGLSKIFAKSLRCSNEAFVSMAMAKPHAEPKKKLLGK